MSLSLSIMTITILGQAGFSPNWSNWSMLGFGVAIIIIILIITVAIAAPFLAILLAPFAALYDWWKCLSIKKRGEILGIKFAFLALLGLFVGFEYPIVHYITGSIIVLAAAIGLLWLVLWLYENNRLIFVVLIVCLSLTFLLVLHILAPALLNVLFPIMAGIGLLCLTLFVIAFILIGFPILVDWLRSIFKR